MLKTSIDWLPELGIRECRTSGDTMGTRYSARFHIPVTTDMNNVLPALAAAVAAVDHQMSNWKADSDLMHLNRAALDLWVPIPAGLATVLNRSLEIERKTGNAFNIGIGDLLDAWGFGPSRTRRQPPPAAGPRPPAHSLLEVDLPNLRARKHGPIALDLCGIAKGYGVDELARVLTAHGIASWLVGIDGELRTRGTKPDGSAWAVGLEAPQDDSRTAIGVIELADAAIATSGDYRHWALVDGQRVSHTMDPRTGRPLRRSPASVTVVAACCMDADAYATALMVAGEDEGSRLARRLGLDALFVYRDGDRWHAVGAGLFDDALGAAR
ncbi:MAG TPA: FAD:protein FMN transferase [Roseateles sp.]